LSRLGGYTLDTLLAEPASIYFELLKLVDRTMADEAIEVIGAGIAGVFGENSKELFEKRGNLFTPLKFSSLEHLNPPIEELKVTDKFNKNCQRQPQKTIEKYTIQNLKKGLED
jgi:hypothetical protein